MLFTFVSDDSDFSFFQRFIYLFESQSYTQREGEGRRERGEGRGRSSIRWFTPQLATKAGAVLMRSQELPPGLPMWVQGPKDLGHLPLLSQAIAKSWIGSGAAETRTGTHMGCWHCGWWLYLLCHSASPDFDFSYKFGTSLNEA